MPADSSRSSDRGFALFISTLALVISMGALLAVAFKLNDNNTQSSTAATGSMPMMSAHAAVENMKVLIKSDEEHGKMGSDGNWHDAFLPADFSVKAGSTVRVTNGFMRGYVSVA